MPDTNTKPEKVITMYLSGIIQYLLWPAFIVLSWFAIRLALNLYEKKFPGEGESN